MQGGEADEILSRPLAFLVGAGDWIDYFIQNVLTNATMETIRASKSMPLSFIHSQRDCF